MKTVETLSEVKANCKKLNEYLNSKVDPEYSFALNLIKKGTCFVVIRNNNEYYFYPSRFIGYANNSMKAHLNNETKDGIETNHAISFLFGSKPCPNPLLDQYYRAYCERLGFEANDKGCFGVERKFWQVWETTID